MNRLRRGWQKLNSRKGAGQRNAERVIQAVMRQLLSGPFCWRLKVPFKLLGLLLAVALLSGQAVLAQNALAERFVILDAQEVLNFTPVQVFFIVGYGPDDLRKIEGFFAPVKNGLGNNERNWFFSVPLSLPAELAEVSYAVSISGANGRQQLLPERRVAMRDLGAFGNGPASLRAYLLNRKAELTELQNQLTQRLGEYRREKTDGSPTANAPSPEAVRTTLDAESESLVLEQQLSNLQDLLEIVKRSPDPANFLKRQEELTGQIKALAEAASTAEGEEEKRRTAWELEANQQRSLLQQAEGEDYDSLVIELASLRKQRENLEQRVRAAGIIGEQSPGGIGEKPAPPARVTDEYELPAR